MTPREMRKASAAGRVFGNFDPNYDYSAGVARNWFHKLTTVPMGYFRTLARTSFLGFTVKLVRPGTPTWEEYPSYDHEFVGLRRLVGGLTLGAYSVIVYKDVK